VSESGDDSIFASRCFPPGANDTQWIKVGGNYTVIGYVIVHLLKVPHVTSVNNLDLYSPLLTKTRI